MLTKPPIFRRFRREETGLAALEFALILPILITMLFGMGELSLLVFCRTDIAQMSSTVADLVAQESAISGPDITNVYNAANTVLYPYYDATAATGSPKKTAPSIRITSIAYDGTSADPNWIGKVAWTCGQTGSGTLPTPTPVANSAYTVPKPSSPSPQPMLAVGGSVIMAEVSYDYYSPTSKIVIGKKTMTSVFYTKPRRVGQIPKPASCS